MSQQHVPAPEPRWRQGQRVRAGPLISGLGIGLALVGIGVAELGSAYGLAAALIFIATGAAVLSASVFPISERLSSPRGVGELGQEAGRTVVRYSAREIPALRLVCATAFLGASAVAVTGAVTGDQGFTILAVPVALFLAACLAATFTGFMTRGWLALSPEGIEHRGWSFTAWAQWSDVVAVEPIGGAPLVGVGATTVHYDKRTVALRYKWVENLPHRGRDHLLLIPCDRFAIDPKLLYFVVHCYATQPALRAELGTDAARARAELLSPLSEARIKPP